jgi:hypothetical protein
VPSATAVSPGLDALLPLTTADLMVGIRRATGFAATYATYRYDETPRAYLARLQPMATPELYAALTRTAATPGLRTQPTSGHESATAQAAPDKLRAVGATSLIIICYIHQTITTSTGTRQNLQRLAVTAIKTTDGTWLINDIQPADGGDQGDPSYAGPN